MKEAERKARNAGRLGECYPPFARCVAQVISALEAEGIRPRIQQAWRSPEDQMAAFASGHSKLKFGFHNITGEAGAPESLAVDVLDDDAPLNPGTIFLLKLAAQARRRGLQTGILWGLPSALAQGVNDAIAQQNWGAKVKVGWDPCHVEVTATTPREAQKIRPVLSGGT